jgi:HTH-type transcriptional regulator/antitoxin HigA
VNVRHFAIDPMGKSQAELAKLIGRNRASEILNRIRPLTLEMIRTISKEWNIPIGVLTTHYKLART